MKLIRKPQEDEKDPSSVTNYIFKLIPFWPLFALMFGLAIGGGFIYLQVVTRLYQTNAKIVIKDDKKGGQDSKAFEALDIISPKKSIDNEIEVIQSKDLMETVVNNLALYAPVYQDKNLRDELAYTTSPIMVTTNDISSLVPAKKVPFKITSAGIVIGKHTYPLNKLVATPYGNLRFIKNQHKLKPAADAEFYFSIIDPAKVTDALASSLKVSSQNKQSTIIDLELTDPDPNRGIDILNEIIKSYNFSITDEKNVLAANTEKFIDERLKTVENNLLSIEHKQQTFQSTRGAVDISTQGKLFLENVSHNDQKVGEISMRLSVLAQIERYIKSKNLANGIVPSTAGIDDPGLTQMVKNIYELQLEVESLKKTTGENNPAVISDMDKIEKIRPQILENLENQRQSLLASRTDISSTSQGYSTQLQSMPEIEKTLVDINREINIQSGIYTFLLQKKEETALSFISNTDGSKTVERPHSSADPVSPNGKMIYLALMLIALLTSLAIASFRESLRRNIMYQVDIEKLTQLPVISEISAGESTDQIVIGSSQRTLIAEQFRKLRTTLGNLGIGGLKKRVLITSAISGEGKSFVAINLAMSLAMTGKKVVILDFDLTSPSLHQKLKVEKGIGVTDFLEGKAGVDQIISPTVLNSCLYFASAGNLSQTPSELITNGKAEELLIELEDKFDYVIIDVAPVGPISDAYILSPLCDATLYIVRHAYTPKIFVERIDKNNLLNKLNNAAIVFNGVSSRNYANYGYGYTYGYGQDAKRLNVAPQ